MPNQTHLDLDTLSAPAQAARDALVAALDGGPEVTELAPEVWDELDASGTLDEIARMEEAGRVDWADPDAHDLETLRWYDERADPHTLLAGGVEAPATCEFFLGTHRPHWLHEGKRERRPAGPMFVSARQLAHNRKASDYPACDTRFAVDSGGFSQLRDHGRYLQSPERYAAQVRRLAETTHTLDWAAIQDWMVEDDALKATGFTVWEHQRRTVASFLRLTALAPEVRWLPVLQGQTIAQYVEHLDMYLAAGVDLRVMHRVGVGSVCRRQSTHEIVDILRALASRGLRLHGFGVKTTGLRQAADQLASADSLAWSLAARREAPGTQNSIHTAEAFRSRLQEIDGVDD